MTVMARPTVLLVEDDRDIRTLLAAFLAAQDFGVEEAEDGRAMDRVLARCRPDIVILDLMLPGEDGLSLCRRLREAGTLPILFLTAKGEEADRIAGFDAGADDYLPKPFNPRELLARVRAILRRTGGGAEEPPRRRFQVGSVVVDLDARSVETEGRDRIPLTSAEFDLLACFVERPQRVLTRDQLIDWTRGRSAEPWDRTIDVTMSRLRRKLTGVDPGLSVLVTTVRNGGYLCTAPVRRI